MSHRLTPLEIMTKLISFPTVSRETNLPLVDWVEGYLNSHGIYNSSLGGAVKGEVFKRPDGVSQTFIQDPDGYWIEINDAN